MTVIRLGIDIGCRSPHHAACADQTGAMLRSRHRFRTTPDDFEQLRRGCPKTSRSRS